MLRLALLLLFLSLSSLLGAFSEEVKGRVLYLAHRGESASAFSLYLEEAKRSESHDYKLLQQAALAVLEQGGRSGEKEVVLHSMIGAGISLHKGAIPILKGGVESKEPEVQLAALNFLFRYEEDETVGLLRMALNSPHLLIRLESLLFLAEKEDPVVVDHLLSLYPKVPNQVKVLFPQILGLVDTPASTLFMRKLLSESEVKIRLSTLLEIAKNGRDDLLPNVRSLTTHPNYAEEEACAFVLGKLQDREASTQLRKLAKRSSKEVQLAATKALFDIGESEALTPLLQHAKEGNPFALSLLGEIPETPEVISCLEQALNHSDTTVQLNAAFALLRLKQESGLPYFSRLFTKKGQDTGYLRERSFGKALFYWKNTPSYKHKAEDNPHLKADTHLFIGKVLQFALELPETVYLPFLTTFLENTDYQEFTPLALQLLSQHQEEAVLSFLKAKERTAGAPLLRGHATLALLKLTQDPIYEDKLLEFLKSEKGRELNFVKPESSLTSVPSPYNLTAEERSTLVITIFETLASERGERVLDVLLDSIAYGNPKNRYALAGLLIRLTE